MHNIGYGASMTNEETSSNGVEDRYAALGHLLAAAGVSTDRTERLISDVLIDDARETRLAISRDICTLVDGYLADFDQRHSRQIDVAQRLVSKISIELEASKRHAREVRSGRTRLIIGLGLLQLLLTIGVLVMLSTGNASVFRACLAVTGGDGTAQLLGAQG